mmetsp:Transcript_34108/g.106187  ORF Transcript_34108/g.106187 Transcript_34108/m.106187 type:complete len:245 (-) Transcript_34108:75-809(-)
MWRLTRAHTLHVLHVQAHAAGDHRVSSHGGEPVADALNPVPCGELGPLTDKRPRLVQDLWRKALDLDLVEAPRQHAVPRLPVLTRLVACKEAIAGEVRYGLLLRPIPELGELRSTRQQLLHDAGVRSPGEVGLGVAVNHGTLRVVLHPRAGAPQVAPHGRAIWVRPVAGEDARSHVVEWYLLGAQQVVPGAQHGYWHAREWESGHHRGHRGRLPPPPPPPPPLPAAGLATSHTTPSQSCTILPW